MFILGDDTHDRGRLPWVTFALIAVNILVFCAQFRFGEQLTNGYALVPKEITEIRDLTTKQPVHRPGEVFVDADGDVHFHRGGKVHLIPHHPGPFPIVLTLFTYQFLHGDIFHLLFNLWFLWIFGRNVECSLGHGKFLSFYLFCGVIAGLAQVGAEASSVIPVVGASGAIAGVMGAYLAIFPWNNMKVVFGGIGLMFGIVEIPAFIVVGLWFVGQFLVGMMTMNDAIGGGTAYWCHIGGFLAGFLSIKAIILYVQYQLRQLEAEHRAEIEAEHPFETVPPDVPILAPAPPTPEQIDNLLDPVETFKRARMGVFRDAPENDPFLRPGEGPLVAHLIQETNDDEAFTETPPKSSDDHAHGIVANLPRPRR